MSDKKQSMKESQIVGYDITLPVNLKWPDKHSVHTFLKMWSKKYVFQKERGDKVTEKNPEGFLHWQGRVSLIKKRRPNELKGKFCVGGHFSPTSSGVHKTQDFNYVMKADSRIEGPWTDKDFIIQPPLTRQLKNFQTLLGETGYYPWQKKMMDLVNIEEDRNITMVYDQIGNLGKSIFVEFLEYNTDLKCFELPPLRSMKEIMEVCMCVSPAKVYVVDMPRGMKKDKLAEFYAGLEYLKNGKMYDLRYSYKSRRINRPQIWVFTNVLPVWDLMSLDRWKVYEVDKNKDMSLLQI